MMLATTNQMEENKMITNEIIIDFIHEDVLSYTPGSIKRLETRAKLLATMFAHLTFLYSDSNTLTRANDYDDTIRHFVKTNDYKTLLEDLEVTF